MKLPKYNSLNVQFTEMHFTTMAVSCWFLKQRILICQTLVKKIIAVMALLIQLFGMCYIFLLYQLVYMFANQDTFQASSLTMATASNI